MRVSYTKASHKNSVSSPEKWASWQVHQDDSRAFTISCRRASELARFFRPTDDVRLQYISSSIHRCVPIQIGTVNTPPWSGDIELSVDNPLGFIRERVSLHIGTVFRWDWPSWEKRLKVDWWRRKGDTSTITTNTYKKHQFSKQTSWYM